MSPVANESVFFECEQSVAGILGELKAALQHAHFAARRLEEVVPADRRDRPADRIHALRTAAEALAAQIASARSALDG